MKLLPDTSRRHAIKRLIAITSIASGTLWISACGRKLPKAAAIPPGATVLALGDSLTQGVGATAGQAYPTLLAERTGWKVVNAGISGETSSQIAARLPELLQTHQPALVILCAGGNDWLRRNSAQAAQAEIARMLQLCKSQGVPVLLVAVPELNLTAALTGRMKDHPVYETLAKAEKVPLLADAWSEVLGDDALRSDQVHANAAGYARFTELLAARLKASGFLPS
ncbi:lysophospholipase L1-like esterase [Comamonas odontotermitis]|uniref:Lysophospholipase L1-like esterase n=1 Tax=Comamonas odontotermitis TaxID=379895 RepID=A0ABR6RJU7_9BURK|nr:GDSL-type esterase/lipase family protein [Comamonas odontotermitis]MBB6579409.1 lysophospholipase L1-like esterase [Comamonas odontotermitis]